MRAAWRGQHARVDLVNVGDAVEAEKDALLERFFAFARHACAALQRRGHWADYIDPCSGLPARAPARRHGTSVSCPLLRSRAAGC